MVRLALVAIRRNALRSSLTVLGIVIGVAAVITMTTIGAGATAKISADIAALGTNLLLVRPGRVRAPAAPASDSAPLKIATRRRCSARFRASAGVAPTAQKQVQAIAGSRNWSTTATGSTVAFLSCGTGTWRVGAASAKARSVPATPCASRRQNGRARALRPRRSGGHAPCGWASSRVS